ncbi:MAG: methionyl-tRNA synthetase [Patescibacteria group bacterium]|nr:methionyl-tRNA synthetase [Patescibacteria group bacterium]
MEDSNKKEENSIVENKYISIEDFAKVEIRLGTIVDIEEVEGSDKLYRLTVDFGEEKEVESESGILEKEKHYRNVFSGIKKFTTPESLKGKQFPFVTNLQPRKMMGEYSQAMILAASGEVGGEEVLSLMSPTQNLSNGTLLR